MPVVPRVQRQVSTAALPGVRTSAAETPLSTGVGIQQATAGTADQIGRIGGEIAQRGGGLYAQMQQEERQKADQIATQAASNKIDDWLIKRVYDPTNGALTQKGEASFTLPETITKEYHDLTSTIEQGLGTEAQKLAFARLKAQQGQSLALTIGRHVANERQNYDAKELDSTVKLKTSLAIAHALDPRQVGVDLGAAVDAITTYGKRNGVGPETVQEQVAAVKSDTHVGVIRNLLAAGKDKAAEIYFDEVSGRSLDRTQWGPRPDGTQKGDGFLGVLQRPDGGVMSEYSVGIMLDGKEQDVPTLVPTLTEAEVKHVLAMKDGDRLPDAIVQKAADYARTRIAEKKPVFAQAGEQQTGLYPGVKRVGVSEIAGDKLDELETAIKNASTATAGLHASEALWQQHGPKGETDPINLDAMETAAREQFKDDPKALDATIRYLRERKAGVDASRKDREEASTGKLWIAASQGATLAQLSRMPEFIAAPGQLQARLSDYIVGQAEHQANRAAALEGRAAAAEGRAYTREQRAKSLKEEQGWSRYWDLSSPATLAATSENQLQAMRGELGDEHVNRLLTQKRAIDKGDETVRAATIDDDLFKTTAAAAGLDAYSPKTDREKSDLGQLKNAVETAIDAEQRATGKTIGRERKEVIMHSLTDQHVMLNTWGFDKEKVASLVTNPDDRAKAYIPIGKVPPTVLTQYLNYARGLDATTQRMSDAELRRRFSGRIERAYALRTLGASRGEIEAAMKGTE